MPDINLIMLSAMYENGGNTTHRLLDGHPQLLVYPFESQVGTGVVNDHLTGAVPLRYRWPEFPMQATPEQDYESFWDEELKTLLRAPARSKFAKADFVMNEDKRRAAFARFITGKPRTRANLVTAYFDSTFAAWENLKRSGRETYYVGYNPAQILDGEKILADFPTGHVLHVVRNPWSGYADTKKRPFPLSLNRYAWTWNQCQMAALSLKELYPDNVHIVRFEDLCENPKSTLAGFLAKAGLEWSDTLLQPTFNSQKMEQIYPWGTIRQATRTANLATANELTAAEQATMEARTVVMRRLLGYDGFLAQCQAA